jgi:hypothetical protein
MRRCIEAVRVLGAEVLLLPLDLHLPPHHAKRPRQQHKRHDQQLHDEIAQGRHHDDEGHHRNDHGLARLYDKPYQR